MLESTAKTNTASKGKKRVSPMLKKLSLRNAKRQIRDYLIYLITVTVSGTLMFGYNSMIFAPDVMELMAQSEITIVMVIFFSLIILLIVGWLIGYMMKFMLQRRSQELGMYMLSGIEKADIVRLFFLENAAVGVVAFAASVLFGGLIYQVLKAFIFQVYQRPYQMSLHYAPGTIAITAVYFLIMYRRSFRKAGKVIKKMEIRDLLYYQKAMEEISVKSGVWTNLIFLVSVVSAAGGMVILLHFPKAAQLMGGGWAGIAAVLLFLIFFYGFYLGAASLLVYITNHKKGIKYRKSRMFLMRGFSSKIGSIHMTLTMVSVLLCLAFVTAGLGGVMGMGLEDTSERILYDVVIGRSGTDTDFSPYQDVLNEIPIIDSYTYTVYRGKGNQFQVNNSGNTFFSFGEGNSYGEGGDVYMGISDYRALRAMLGYEDLPQSEHEYYLHTLPGAREEVESTGSKYNALTIGSYEMRFAGVFMESFGLYSNSINGIRVVVIVPDDVLGELTPVRTFWAGMTEGDMPIAAYEKLAGIAEGIERDHHLDGYTEFEFVLSRSMNADDKAMVFSGFILPLYYLAFILAIAAITIIATLFLSDGEKYRRQYHTLNQLGVAAGQRRRFVFHQVSLYFLLPAVLPLIAGVCLTYVFATEMAGLALFDMGRIYTMIGGVVLLYLLVYMVYYLTTWISFHRQVLGKEI